MNKNKELFDAIKTTIALCIISFGFIGFGIHIFWISPKNLCDCSYSQGTLEEKNTYYKTISLNLEDKPIASDIPCSEYNSIRYFRSFNDELFEKMNSILSADTTEHYVQIWFQWFKGGGDVRGPGLISCDYYQIIIDGIIIKSFNKWDNKKVAIGALIIGFALLVLTCVGYYKDRKKILRTELSK